MERIAARSEGERNAELTAAEHDIGCRELVAENPIIAIQRFVPGLDHQVEIAPATPLTIAFHLVEFLRHGRLDDGWGV